MHKIFILLFACVLTINLCDGARILCIFPTPSFSHQIVYRTITEELARRGHHLTIMTTDPVDYKEPEFANITQIDVHNISYDIWTNFFKFIDRSSLYRSPRLFLINYYDIVYKITDEQLSQPEMKKLISDSTKHFDLCILESNAPPMFAFKDLFKCPLIQVNSIGLAPQNHNSFGNSIHLFLHLNNFASLDVRNLTIMDKLELLYSELLFNIFYYSYFIPKYTWLSKKHFGQRTRSVDEIENESDLILMNYHPVLHGIMPTVPAMVGIGSIHIKPHTPLPEDLQKIMDEATAGVIYFNLGTNVKSKHLPESKRNAILQAFREMPYTVIWKWEDDMLPGKPSNVHISKWLPQQSILAHPNLKLFITQGGKQSIEETIHHSIPIIGISFFGDQYANCFKMVQHGAGLTIAFDKLTTENLKETANEIITNPKYKENIIKLRDILYDQPQTPLERAIWWIEYVIRHKGAKHLRSPAADISYFHFYMVDIFLFLIAFIVVVYYAIKMIIHMFSKYSIVIRTGKQKKVD